jgi:hypothetical protein
MEAESLIPEEARARVGREIGRAQGQVVKQEFQRWAASSFSFQNRASAFAGDELSFAGTVIGKRADGDRGLVDLELRAEKGPGRVLMPGTATVSLPRRR